MGERQPFQTAHIRVFLIYNCLNFADVKLLLTVVRQGYILRRFRIRIYSILSYLNTVNILVQAF